MRKLFITLGRVALSAIIGAGIWQLYVRCESRKYNLITLDITEVPDPIDVPATEDNIRLSEITMHYAVYGENGYPLILVHGNGGSKKSLHEAATYLANDYKVYVHLKGDEFGPGSNLCQRIYNYYQVDFDTSASFKENKKYCNIYKIMKNQT